jgi:hypothetical protein
MTSAAQQYYHPGHTEYAAAITAGAASLNIEVPVHLQHSLVDRYGQHTSWSIAGEVASDHHVQAMGCDATSGFDVVPYPQVAGYEYGNEEVKGDLAGIGAQFDY